MVIMILIMVIVIMLMMTVIINDGHKLSTIIAIIIILMIGTTHGMYICVCGCTMPTSLTPPCTAIALVCGASPPGR